MKGSIISDLNTHPTTHTQHMIHSSNLPPGTATMYIPVIIQEPVLLSGIEYDTVSPLTVYGDGCNSVCCCYHAGLNWALIVQLLTWKCIEFTCKLPHTHTHGTAHVHYVVTQRVPCNKPRATTFTELTVVGLHQHNCQQNTHTPHTLSLSLSNLSLSTLIAATPSLTISTLTTGAQSS